MSKFLAHIAVAGDERREQTMLNHSVIVARYAADKLKDMNLYHTAYLAGLLHDMGKYTAKYQQYLQRAANGEHVVRGCVNHTFCGCIYLLKNYHIGRPQGLDTVTCEILVYAMGAHHGQFDCVTLDSTSGFEHRLNKDLAEIDYDAAVDSFLAECASREEIDRLFALAQDEITAMFQALKVNFGKGTSQISFLIGMAARMVLSAVIDADRRDTAEFMSGCKLDYRHGTENLWAQQIDFFEGKIAAFDKSTPINQARSVFSEQCRDFAQKYGGGIYRLTLPTGAGKTLTALRYALHHAKQHSKKRVIFVIPLLSILEQNSAVIRQYIGDESIITEHHSNVVKVFEQSEKLDQYELVTQTWSSPIIITTLVQLLNTLFSDQTTAVRRMSALSDAVIVIDEIQSLPKKTTNMFTMALNFLASYCGATVVLSSATQPCFDETSMPLKFSPQQDIVPYDKEAFAVFKRTELIDKTSPYGWSMDELSDFATETIGESSSLLLICNTKETARKLYTQLKQRYGDYRIFHLSTSMCMAHRSKTLADINDALKNKEKILCVSTQLVEAGVDFSFESVIRVVAGMDNIAQAAGRCNRSNEYGYLCKVYIVNLRQDAERLTMLQEIAAAQRCTQKVLHQFAQDAKRYEDELLSQKSIEGYYQFLFCDEDIRGKFSFPKKLNRNTTVSLFDLLADNKKYTERPNYQGKYFLKQAFQTAGKLFEVFDEQTSELIVPYNQEAEEIIADLFSKKATYDYSFIKACIERAKPYTIQVFESQYKKLAEYGMLSSRGDERFIALHKRCYHDDVGLVSDDFIY